MTKKEAARMGGRAVYEKYGSEYMSKIGKRGAQVFYERYELHPYGTSEFAIVRKEDGKRVAIRHS